MNTANPSPLNRSPRRVAPRHAQTYIASEHQSAESITADRPAGLSPLSIFALLLFTMAHPGAGQAKVSPGFDARPLLSALPAELAPKQGAPVLTAPVLTTPVLTTPVLTAALPARSADSSPLFRLPTAKTPPFLSSLPANTASRTLKLPRLASRLSEVVEISGHGRAIEPHHAIRPPAAQSAKAHREAAHREAAPQVSRVSSHKANAPAPRAVDTLPAAERVPQKIAQDEIPVNLVGMNKVVNVPSDVAPASQPLPESLKKAAVSADAKFISVPSGKGGNGKVFAQNLDAPPMTRPSRPVTNSDRLPNQIEVAVSTFVVLMTTSDLQTVAVADPNIADVAVVNARAVLVNGKQPGITSLVVVDRMKIRQYQVRVTAPSGSRPEDIIDSIGLPGVRIRQLGDSLVLEGEVNDTQEMKRAVDVAGAYSAKVINQLTIRGAQSSEAGLASQIQNTIALPNVTVRVVGDTAFLDGSVSSLAEYQRAETVAKALTKTVVNLIKLPTVTVEQVRQSLGGLEAPPSGPLPPNAPPPLVVRQVGEQIVLEGTVPSPEQLEQALQLAGRSGLQVVNRVVVAPSVSTEGALLNSVESAIGIPGVRVRGTTKRLVLQGVVADTNAAVAAEQIARAFAPEVDNLLQTPNPLLVNVDVSIVEINKNDARDLGVQIGTVSLLTEAVTVTPPTIIPGVSGSNGSPSIPAQVVPGTGGTQRTITLGTNFNQGQFRLGEDVTGSFRNLDPLRVRLGALYSKGNARLLSNPRTTVLSGRTATFQVGGQVPIPALSNVGANGATTGIVFKDFGILVDVIPVATTDGVVTMRVRTEVSAPDFTNGVTPPGGGSVIPGFSRRSTVTEVTVQRNGTLALSGLIRNDVTKAESHIPILSKIPIIGSLFKSKSFTHDESELVIFVTPRVLDNPLAPGATAPAGVVAVGNTINAGTMTGNPGIPSFNTGSIFSNAGGGTPGGGTGSGGGQ